MDGWWRCCTKVRAIGNKSRLSGQKLREAIHIPAAGGMHKLAKERFLLFYIDLEARLLARNAFTGAPKYLPAVIFALFNNASDFAIVPVENLSQQKDGAFHRGKAFEHH